MTRLASIALPAEVAGYGRVGTINCDAPAGQWVGWSVSIRGAAVFLVSPRGWVRGVTSANLRNPKDPARAFEIARVNCQLVWEGDDIAASIDKSIQRHDTGPFETAVRAPDPDEAMLGRKDVGDA